MSRHLMRFVKVAAVTAGEPDTSVESITLQFKGLGEHASFFIDGQLIDGSGSASVSYAGGVYTVSGLSQDDLDNFGFLQAAGAISNLQVRAQTVESANGDTSAWTHAEADPWAQIATSINPQYGTTGNDELLWSGQALNGRSGDDTVQLRFDESLSGATLSAQLDNIERLDLTGAGANSITSLRAEDVFEMTDARNTLRIDGDAGGADSVLLDAGSGWTLDAGAGLTGYTVYLAAHGADTVRLEVANGVHIE